MKNWFRNILFSIIALVAFSCNSTKKDNFTKVLQDHGVNENEINKNYELIGNKDELISYAEFGDVGYNLKAVSALDFLKRQGKKVDKDDLGDLNKESVVIIEFSSLTNKGVTDLDQFKLTDDNLMMYLSGTFNEKVQCLQNGEVQTPSGAQLDGALRIDNKIKILLFGLKVDLNKPFKVEYFDAIFGAGKMIFEFNKNKPLV